MRYGQPRYDGGKSYGKKVKSSILLVTEGFTFCIFFSYNDVFTCKALTTEGLRTIRLRDHHLNRDGTEDKKPTKTSQLRERRRCKRKRYHFQFVRRLEREASRLSLAGTEMLEERMRRTKSALMAD
ncbi:hypothetical protein ILYODFUR_038541 [Ilyodon furcidens]|uniref:Uncharacterized protein n=1 Tax=Ilyodon furcidens TaxID=33524 RepID=A0ABV0SVT1_9TELE